MKLVGGTSAGEKQQGQALDLWECLLQVLGVHKSSGGGWTRAWKGNHQEASTQYINFICFRNHELKAEIKTRYSVLTQLLTAVFQETVTWI